MSTFTTRRQFLGAASLALPSLAAQEPKARPNIVIIFLDDGGYADFHPFGRPPYPTPDRKSVV